jgi:hypothetical protein
MSVISSGNGRGPRERAFSLLRRCFGAAQESNLPTVGLLRLTGFEDQLGHRARPLRH